jgi:ribosomal protein S14
MSSPRYIESSCEKCGRSEMEVQNMTVSYETSIELETKETVHRHASTVYRLRCRHCGHTFSRTISVPEP